jgi:hypothetical protein
MIFCCQVIVFPDVRLELNGSKVDFKVDLK